MKCTQCGTDNQPSARFCVSCGHSIQVLQPMAQPPAAGGNMRNLALTGGGVPVAAALAFGWQNHRQEQALAQERANAQVALKAEQDRAQAERQAREKVEEAARQKAQTEAQERARTEQEAKLKAELDAKSKLEEQAKAAARAEQDAKAKAEQERRARADRMAAERAAAERRVVLAPPALALASNPAPLAMVTAAPQPAPQPAMPAEEPWLKALRAELARCQGKSTIGAGLCVRRAHDKYCAGNYGKAPECA